MDKAALKICVLGMALFEWCKLSLAREWLQGKGQDGPAWQAGVDLASSRSRGLLNWEPPNSGSTFVVRTGDDFKAALHSGAVHIELQDHLDLSGQSWREPEPVSAVPFVIPHYVQSIRGNCSEQPFKSDAFRSRIGLLPSDLPLDAPKAPHQCLIVIGEKARTELGSTSLTFITDCPQAPGLTTGGHLAPLWLDGVYVKDVSRAWVDTSDPGRSRSTSQALHIDRRLYMTNVTMQGSSAAGGGALWLQQQAVLADSKFLDWRSNRGSVIVAVGSHASVQRTDFRRNAVTHSGALVVLDRYNTQGRFQRTSFANNTFQSPVKQRGGGKNCTNADEYPPGAPVPHLSDGGFAIDYNSGQQYYVSDYFDSYSPYEDEDPLVYGDWTEGGEDVFSDAPLRVARNCVPSVPALPLRLAHGFPSLGDEELVAIQKASLGNPPAQPRVSALGDAYRFRVHDCTPPGQDHSVREEYPDFDREEGGGGFSFGFVGFSLVLFFCCCLPLYRILKARRLVLNVAQTGAGGHAVPPGPRAAAAGVGTQSQLAETATKEAPKELYRVGTHRWATEPATEAKKMAAAVSKHPSESTSDSISNGLGERFYSISSSMEVPVYVPPATIPTVPEEATCSHDHTDGSAQAGVGEGPPLGHASQALPGQSTHLRAESTHLRAAANSSTFGIRDTSCVICFDNIGDHVMVPCGHGGYCRTCAQRMFESGAALCPICRAPVDTVVKVSLDTPIGECAPAAHTRLLTPMPPRHGGYSGAGGVV